jgi:hypothetical protein
MKKHSRSEVQKKRRANRRKARAAGPVEYENWKRFRAAVLEQASLSPSKRMNYLYREAVRRGNDQALKFLSKANNVPVETTATFN